MPKRSRRRIANPLLSGSSPDRCSMPGWRNEYALVLETSSFGSERASRIGLAEPACKTVFPIGESGFESPGTHQFHARVDQWVESSRSRREQCAFESHLGHQDFSEERRKNHGKQDAVSDDLRRADP